MAMIPVSGRSSGGTNLIGRALRAMDNNVHVRPVQFLVTQGAAQEQMVEKLLSDIALLRRVTGTQYPIEVYEEDIYGFPVQVSA